MESLHISQQLFHCGQHQRLYVPELTLQRGDSFAFIGANGSGKSTLGAVLAGDIAPSHGHLISTLYRPVCFSFEKLAARLDTEWQQ